MIEFDELFLPSLPCHDSKSGKGRKVPRSLREMLQSVHTPCFVHSGRKIHSVPCTDVGKVTSDSWPSCVSEKPYADYDVTSTSRYNNHSVVFTHSLMPFIHTLQNINEFCDYGPPVFKVTCFDKLQLLGMIS